MVETNIDVARAAIETSFRLRHHSLAGSASFRRGMDHSDSQSRPRANCSSAFANVTAMTWPEVGKIRTQVLLPCRPSMPTFSALHFETW